MSIRTLALAVMALAALFLVALAPTGAAAHGGAPHAHAVKHLSEGDVAKDAAAPLSAELRAQAPLSSGHHADADCGERGCCSAGHCSGCATALAPISWACLRLTSDALLPSPDATRPTSLAREGPPRPPKSFA